MRRYLLVFMAALFLFGNAHAEDSYFEQFLTLDTCEHRWSMLYTESVLLPDGSVANVIETQLTKYYISAGSWHAEIKYNMNRCDVCGLEQYMPSVQEFPHCYRVTDEKMTEDDVTLTYTCDDCGHVRREKLSLAELRSVDRASDAADCMHGGVCRQAGLFTNVEIGRRTVLDGQPYYLTRVLVEEEGQWVPKVAQRLHCPFCRRPHLQHISKLDESWEGYDELPQMTYVEFMTVKTEENLPYMVIDRLCSMQ